MTKISLEREHEVLVKQLVSIESVSTKENNLRGFIKEWFEKEGLAVIEYEGNLIVKIEGRDSERVLIMNSHMDTVSPGDGWTTNHLGEVDAEDEDKLYGLGASDMKAGLAASMLFARNMHRVGVPPTDLLFTYVVEEETDGTGSRAVAQWFESTGSSDQYWGAAAIFTEPTLLTDVEHGHRGNMFLEATSVGESGHASRPIDDEDHAVMKMYEFAQILTTELFKWHREFPSEIFALPTIAVLTSIRAGVVAEGGEVVTAAPNKYPATCVATFDVRTTPEFHKVAFERISQIAAKFGITVRHLYKESPAGFTELSDPIVQAALRVIRESGVEPTTSVSMGAADMGFFSAIGIHGIILGPGDKTVIHQPNEYVQMSQVAQAAELYQQVYNEWVMLSTPTTR
jgi:succinyl-diaminopimelate desuccinylase